MTNVVGNVQQKLQQVQMLPVFIEIGLGVLLGSIPFYLPGFPAALKLGLAGWRAAGGSTDPVADWQHRQTLLAHAPPVPTWRYGRSVSCCFWLW